MVSHKFNLHGPDADRLIIRQPKATPRYHGHFLSIIAFDGNITMDTFESVLQAQHKKGLWRGWKLHAGEGQGRSRNECAHRFLTDTDCEFHFLSDADLRFTPEHVLALRRHPEAKDSIICGAYPKKQEKIEFCVNTLKDGAEEPDKMQKMEVAKGGTGFMQIPRCVYEKVRAAYPQHNYMCDYEFTEDKKRIEKHGFFCEQIMLDDEVGFNRHMTEDWMFCYWARKAGVKIYMDFSTTAAPWITHRGPVHYPLPTEIERGRVQEELDKANARIAELQQKLSGS